MPAKKENSKAESSGAEGAQEDQAQQRQQEMEKASQEAAKNAEENPLLPSGNQVDEIVPVGQEPGDTLRKRVIQAGPEWAAAGGTMVEVTEDVVVEEFFHPGAQRPSHRQLAVGGTRMPAQVAEQMGITSVREV